MGQSESYEVSTCRYKDTVQEKMVCNRIMKTRVHFMPCYRAVRFYQESCLEKLDSHIASKYMNCFFKSVQQLLTLPSQKNIFRAEHLLSGIYSTVLPSGDINVCQAFIFAVALMKLTSQYYIKGLFNSSLLEKKGSSFHRSS